jgi:hypothetical protein
MKTNPGGETGLSERATTTTRDYFCPYCLAPMTSITQLESQQAHFQFECGLQLVDRKVIRGGCPFA